MDSDISTADSYGKGDGEAKASVHVFCRLRKGIQHSEARSNYGKNDYCDC